MSRVSLPNLYFTVSQVVLMNDQVWERLPKESQCNPIICWQSEGKRWRWTLIYCVKHSFPWETLPRRHLRNLFQDSYFPGVFSLSFESHGWDLMNCAGHFQLSNFIKMCLVLQMLQWSLEKIFPLEKSTFTSHPLS